MRSYNILRYRNYKSKLHLDLHRGRANHAPPPLERDASVHTVFRCSERPIYPPAGSTPGRVFNPLPETYYGRALVLLYMRATVHCIYVRARDLQRSRNKVAVRSHIYALMVFLAAAVTPMVIEAVACNQNHKSVK